MKTLSLVLALMAASLATLAAKPVDLPDEKLHLDIPDAWTTNTPSDPIIFSAADGQNTSAANLLKMPNDRGDGLDEPEFVNGIKEGFVNKVKAQGMNVAITQEGQTVLNGVPFYNFQGNFSTSGGQTTNFHMYVTAANGQIYMLSLQSVKADADAEAEFLGIANSLSFTAPPVLPDPNRPKTQSERIGYYFGMFIGVLAVISIFKWIRNLGRRRSKTTAS
jgi:hypothetical protein